jgi:hypothetical protein
MKKATFAIMMICLVMAGFKATAADNKKVLGSWRIVVADAPYEYSNSTLIVTEVSGNLDVKIQFPDGQSIKGASPSFSNDVLKFSIDIEGNDVVFSGKVTEMTLTGSVDTPEGMMNVKGEKITLIGTWDYTAPDAPYEYSSGKIQFTELSGKYSGKVIGADGSQMPVSDLKIDNLSFSFSIQIEYETVKVSGKLANGRITGKADSPEGVIAITATRTKAKN